MGQELVRGVPIHPSDMLLTPSPFFTSIFFIKASKRQLTQWHAAPPLVPLPLLRRSKSILLMQQYSDAYIRSFNAPPHNILNSSAAG